MFSSGYKYCAEIIKYLVEKLLLGCDDLMAAFIFIDKKYQV